MAAKSLVFQKNSGAIGAQTEDGTSDWITDLHEMQRFVLQLKVTAAATEAGDLLKVWVQTSFDGGTTPHDVARFADILGNGGTVCRRLSWVADAVTTAEEAQQDAAIAASAVRNGPIGDRLRLKWTITDAGTDNASFTFAVTGWARS